MIRHIFKRLLILVVTLLGITALTFFCIRALPGEVGEGLESEGRTESSGEEVDHRRRLYALDQPIPLQYWTWLTHCARLDFGHSWISSRPVGEMLRDAVPRSLQVMIPSILLWYGLGIPLGVFLALRRRSMLARMTTAGLLALYSLPGFFLGTLLIVTFASPEWFCWFPSSGLQGDLVAEYAGFGWMFSTSEGWSFLVDRVWHLVLPVVCMVVATTAYLAEQTRVSMLESLGKPWIRTARAKGLSEVRVVVRHALRHALIPLVMLAALALPAAFTGSVFLEKIFSIEGVGWTFIQAVGERDHPVVMAVTTMAAALTLLGVLFSDVLAAMVDPRIEFR